MQNIEITNANDFAGQINGYMPVSIQKLFKIATVLYVSSICWFDDNKNKAKSEEEQKKCNVSSWLLELVVCQGICSTRLKCIQTCVRQSCFAAAVRLMLLWVEKKKKNPSGVENVRRNHFHLICELFNQSIKGCTKCTLQASIWMLHIDYNVGMQLNSMQIVCQHTYTHTISQISINQFDVVTHI